ncbi:MAG TPA: class I tRNA ligase family protein [Anaerolineales bacterium]|nr:class I tRNA ligase family protein [Anaerolineales bacterium]
MPFKEVPNNVDFQAQELEVLKFWKEHHSFEKMVALHQGQPKWSFIDGPITANNPMGVHHGWGRTYKDWMLRFRTMQGHELRYQNGFDCQGLWVEVNVERDLGFKSKLDIEEYGLAKFVLKCKERVLRYAAVQTEQSIRLGFWMDWNDTEMLNDLAVKLMQDPTQVITVPGPNGPFTGSVEQVVAHLGLPELGGSYFTFSNENNYMIWAFLKKCWQKGWLYKGDDVMPWCPRCATGISQHEIATEGYQQVTHRSVTLRFPLVGREKESLLVWTTTPWTLTSNVAAAVGPELTYVKVKQRDEVLYLSKGTLDMLKGPYDVLGVLKGTEMEGWPYWGPFDDLEPAQRPGGFTYLTGLIREVKLNAVQAHRVILWDAVGEEEGTGIVHIAPGAGAEDFQLSKQNHLPIIAPLNEEGEFLDGFGWLSGMHVSEVADAIFDNLKRKGLLYRVEPYTHRYPVCWRCGTELVFRLVDEWFISMGVSYDKPRNQLTTEEKAASLRYQIMDVVDQIKWIPEFGHSREMDWLRNMHDWMISKKRYWGLALPIWECEACGNFEVIGSDDELKQRAIAGLDVLGDHTPHRPYIDAVTIPCSKCGTNMRRVRDVGNPWLDAGIVSFSTLNYRKNPDFWRKWYPADWISESFPGQFRNWFYSLLAMATVVDGTPPFLENYSYATLLDEYGKPMHKSSGNMIEFNEAADKMGVDTMRWLFFSQKPENDLWFGYKAGDQVRADFIIPLWNVYSFFANYARLDGWHPTGKFNPDFPEGPTPHSDNLMDGWILARLNQVVESMGTYTSASDPLNASLVCEAFLDDLSNWYVRRNKRRFWKSEHDADKNTAYSTLYHVLVKFAKTLAPFIPFITEVMYQNLVRNVRPAAYESIHHTTWPEVDQTVKDDDLLEQMSLARRVASLGLSARKAANLKVRQPLAKVLVSAGKAVLREDLVEVVMDELNVKAFEFVEREGELVQYKVLPDNKLLGPKFGARFPQVRAALAQADPSKVAASVLAGMPYTLEVAGEKLVLDPETILVSTEPLPGLAVAGEKNVTVAIDASITPELKAEGLAREVVRRVQDMRKKAGFDIADRITTCYQAKGQLAKAISKWKNFIKSETLTTQLRKAPPIKGAYVEEFELEGEKLVLAVKQNKK